MKSFSDTVVDNDERCKWISPPPAKEGIEQESNQDRSCKVGIDHRDAPFGEQDLILSLLPCRPFAKGKQEHGNEGSGNPDNASNRGTGVGPREECVDQLSKDVDYQRNERNSDEPKGQMLALLIHSSELPNDHH